jgi:hypothetical protein
MRLAGTMTFKTEQGDVVLASSKDLGAAPSPPTIQHALHTFAGGMVNDLAVQAEVGVFKGLSITVED